MLVFASGLYGQATPKPHLQIELGHTGQVISVAVSPDGRTALSADHQANLKLWDISSGRLIRTFVWGAAYVSNVALAFSPDGRVALEGVSGKAALWNVVTGQMLRIIGMPFEDGGMAFSPDTASVLISRKLSLALWDIASDKLIRTFGGEHSYGYAVALSPDGKMALAVTGTGTIELWDVGTGQLNRTFDISGFATNLLLRFTPDGRSALVADIDSISLLDIERGKTKWRSETNIDTDGAVRAITISPDGLTATIGRGKTLQLWDLSTGRVIRSFAKSGDFQSVIFLADGGKLLSGSSDHTVQLWDVATAQSIRIFDGQVDPFGSLVFSPDGRMILASNMELWDPAAATPLHDYGQETVWSSVFSPDGKTFITTYKDWKFRVMDLATGTTVRIFGEDKSVDEKTWQNHISLSADGTTLLASSNATPWLGIGDQRNSTLSLWDAKTGKKLKTLFDDKSGATNDFTSIVLSQDAKTALTVQGGTLKFWDISAGVVTHSFDARAIRVALSPDGKTALSGGGELDLWDVVSGKLIRTFASPQGDIESVAFSPDGHTALSASGYGPIWMWDVASGVLLRTFPSYETPVLSVAFSNDGKTMMSSSEDGTIKLWDLGTGRLRYSAVSTSKGEWLAWTPEGFFAGTEWATHHFVDIVDEMKVVGIDQVYNIYYRPDLVEAKAEGKDISAFAIGLDLATLLHSGGLPPQVEIETPAAPSTTTERDITLRFKVTDQGGGVGTVTIFNGDTPLVVSEGTRGLKVIGVGAPKDSSQLALGISYESVLTLHGGANTIAVSAYNAKGTIESNRASVEVVYGTTIVTKPSLYILAVAVQKYRDRDLALKYSVDDATALSTALQKQAGALYQGVHVATLFDDQVTKEGFSSAFDALSKVVAPDDVFVLYFAGHGVTNAQDGEYYFLPVNFRYNGAESIAEQGISKNDILANMTKITAQKSLLLFDTCNSGSLLKDSPVGRGIEEKTAVDRLKHAVGRALIVASGDDQSALEGYENHGVFTYVLLQGLSGAAVVGDSGYISVTGLTSYVVNTVPDLTYKKWGYEQDPQSELPKQDFPLVSR